MTTPVNRLLDKLSDVHKTANGWSARCPAHDDQQPSLSISEGEDGRVLVHCHANCTADAICAAVGLELKDLMPTTDTRHAPSKPKCNGDRRIVAQYDYQDEAGKLLFQAVRYEPKDFRQRQPNGNGGWQWNVQGVRVVPYRLPDLLVTPSAPVFVVEGEKDCDSLADAGVIATCNAGGAGKWTDEHSTFLRDREVVILPDNDEAGDGHARRVAESLWGVAASIRVVELPGLPPKGDVSDWLAAGGTLDELERLVEAAPVWTPATEPWANVVSFDDHQLPEFPTHALPARLRNWVRAESHATQTPADLAGLLALAVCSAVIARRVVVQPRDGWTEPSNLYVAVLLDPGNRKSAVFNDALRPLRELEAEAIAAARPTVARAQSERRQDEARLKTLERRAVETGGLTERDHASDLAAALAERVEPVLPRLLADDVTNEKLGMLLNEQGGRIASMAPEGSAFELMAGLYSKNRSPSFIVYLKTHAGDDLTTDRVSRASVHVKRPALTCAYAIQPQVIRALAANPAFRDQGLMGRFLFARPLSWIGRREIAPLPVSEATRLVYRELVRGVAGYFEDFEDTTEPFVLRLTPDAECRLREWEAEIESMLGDGGQMESIRDWGSKLPGATLRLAAVMHCLDHKPSELIGVDTIEAAVEIGRYLIPHARAVLMMTNANKESTDDDARYLLRWIERHGLSEFTKRDAHQHGKSRFSKADDLDPALAELIRRGYIRWLPTERSGPGRPPSPMYQVNPVVVLTNESLENHSHYSQNSSHGPAPANSENCADGSQGAEISDRVQVTI